MLIGADKGLFLAREVNGRVTVTAATNANTGGVSGLHEFPGGTVLVGAGNGLFLAREANGLVTVAPVPAQTGTVTNLLGLPDGAVLIQAASGWFLGREEANGRVTVASTGKVDTGAIFGLRKLPGGTVLIGAKNGLFFAGEGNERVAVTAANAQTLETYLGCTNSRAAECWLGLPTDCSLPFQPHFQMRLSRSETRKTSMKAQ